MTEFIQRVLREFGVVDVNDVVMMRKGFSMFLKLFSLWVPF
jgi:hypothetical protein